MVVLECHFTWQAKHLVMSECRCAVQCKDVSCVTRIMRVNENPFSWQAQYLVMSGCHFFRGTPSMLDCHFWWQAHHLVGLEKSCLVASAAFGTPMETQRYRAEPLR